MMYGYIYSMLVSLEFLFSTAFSLFLCKGGMKLYRKIIVVSHKNSRKLPKYQYKSVVQYTCAISCFNTCVT